MNSKQQKAKLITYVSKKIDFPDEENCDYKFSSDKYTINHYQCFENKLMKLSIMSDSQIKLKLYVCFGKEESKLKNRWAHSLHDGSEMIKSKFQNGQSGPSAEYLKLGVNINAEDQEDKHKDNFSH